MTLLWAEESRVFHIAVFQLLSMLSCLEIESRMRCSIIFMQDFTLGFLAWGVFLSGLIGLDEFETDSYSLKRPNRPGLRFRLLT
jgi:hypothetical protein